MVKSRKKRENNPGLVGENVQSKVWAKHNVWPRLLAVCTSSGKSGDDIVPLTVTRAEFLLFNWKYSYQTEDKHFECKNGIYWRIPFWPLEQRTHWFSIIRRGSVLCTALMRIRLCLQGIQKWNLLPERCIWCYLVMDTCSTWGPTLTKNDLSFRICAMLRTCISKVVMVFAYENLLRRMRADLWISIPQLWVPDWSSEKWSRSRFVISPNNCSDRYYQSWFGMR